MKLIIKAGVAEHQKRTANWVSVPDGCIFINDAADNNGKQRLIK